MKFCPECQFMLKITENKEGELIQRCDTCGFTQKSNDTIISTTYYKKNNNSMENLNINANYIHDQTYSRTIHYNCPNEACQTKKDESLKEAVLRNDKESEQLIYICSVCNTQWK